MGAVVEFPACNVIKFPRERVRPTNLDEAYRAIDAFELEHPGLSKGLSLAYQVLRGVELELERFGDEGG